MNDSTSHHELLSKLQYRNVTTKLMMVTLTGIVDLFEVKMTVGDLNNWQDLGLALGLLYPTLVRIEKEQRGKIKDCLRVMLAAWLQQQDNVSKNGAPSWAVLQTALRKIAQ